MIKWRIGDLLDKASPTTTDEAGQEALNRYRVARARIEELKQGELEQNLIGPKYFKKWWDKACKNLGVRGVDLYGGTKHTTATALGYFLTPEQIKRGGTGSATNKAFETSFQPRRTLCAKVVSAIKKLQKMMASKIVKLRNKKMLPE